MNRFLMPSASFGVPPQAQLYQPPPIAAIPVVKQASRLDWVWSEPDQQETPHDVWGWYSEHVPALEGITYPEASLDIDIEMWGESMRLRCYAAPAYFERHDMQWSQYIPIPKPERKQYEVRATVYAQLKAQALEWLSYARAYIYRSMFLDAEERRLMGAISLLERFRYSERARRDIQITTTAIARQGDWMITPFYHGFLVPDTRQVLFLLTALIARGYLEEKDIGPEGTTYGTVGYPNAGNRETWHTYPRWEEFVASGLASEKEGLCL